MSNAGGRGETRFTTFISKINVVKRGIHRGIAIGRAAPVEMAHTQQRQEGGLGSGNTMTTTHIGDGVEDGTGQLVTFIRKVSTANAAAVVSKARGASIASPVVGDGGKRLVP